MILRPNLNILINKLQEVKKQGIDIILFTTARNEWVERFFKLKPEFKLLFNNELFKFVFKSNYCFFRN